MKLGRDFTNLLNIYFLSEEEKTLLKEGKIKVPNVDAKIQCIVKKDVKFQVEMARKTNIEHIELDGSIPNPYLDMNETTLTEIKKMSEDNGITLSFHLPYTFVATSISCLQEEDRKLAVKYMKEYIVKAQKMGCKTLILHPGSIPFYLREDDYLKKIKENLIKSLQELSHFSYNLGTILHMENNTAFDNFLYECDDCLEIVKEVNYLRNTLKFCFDIGHWFTRKDIGLEIPKDYEKIIQKIPQEYIYEMHINDYIPVEKRFHPPLHYKIGLLNDEKIKIILNLLKQKNTKILVIETAVREPYELLNSQYILFEETNYIKKLLSEVNI